MTVSSQTNASLPQRLWRGEVGFADAFWRYGLLYGTLLNLVLAFAALALLINEAPVALALVVFFLPLPYNLLAVVAVWRAKDSPSWGRLAIIVWALFMTVI